MALCTWKISGFNRERSAQRCNLVLVKNLISRSSFHLQSFLFLFLCQFCRNSPKHTEPLNHQLRSHRTSSVNHENFQDTKTPSKLNDVCKPQSNMHPHLQLWFNSGRSWALLPSRVFAPGQQRVEMDSGDIDRLCKRGDHRCRRHHHHHHHHHHHSRRSKVVKGKGTDRIWGSYDCVASFHWALQKLNSMLLRPAWWYCNWNLLGHQNSFHV